MDVQILGAVDYREPQKLILESQDFYKKEYRRLSLFKKNFFQAYSSPNNKYCFNFKYKSEIRWGSAYYNIYFYANDNAKELVKRDFGERIFGANYLTNPWNSDSDMFCLIEWYTIEEGKIETSLVLFAVDRSIEETLVRENGLISFLSWSPNSNYILYKVYLNNSVNINLINLKTRKIESIGHEESYQSYFGFFDKEEKYLIAIDQKDKPCLKIFELPSMDIKHIQDLSPNVLESIERIKPYVRKISYPAGKNGTTWIEKKEKEGKYWDTVFFNKDTNILYLGILRSSSWYKGDYFKSMEWVRYSFSFE